MKIIEIMVFWNVTSCILVGSTLLRVETGFGKYSCHACIVLGICRYIINGGIWAPILILNQISPVHTSHCQFLKINFKILLPFTPRSSKLSYILRSDHQDPVCTLFVSHTCHMPLPVTSSLLCRNAFLSSLFSYTLSLCFALNLKDQVSHTHKKGQNYSSVCYSSYFWTKSPSQRQSGK